MHSALLGVSKLTLHLWISDQHIDTGFVIERMKQINVPTEVAQGIYELKHRKGYILYSYTLLEMICCGSKLLSVFWTKMV